MSDRLIAFCLVLLSGSIALAGPLAYTPDGRTLVLADPDGQLRIYTPATATEPISLRAHKGSVLDLAVSPDGRRVITAGADGCVRIWDRATWKETATFRGHAGAVYSVAFSPDGKLAASGGADKTARLWDPATGIEQAKLDGHADAVVSVCFSGDGRYLYSGSTIEDKDIFGSRRGAPIRRWDASDGKPSEFSAMSGHTVAASARLLAIGNEVLSPPPTGKGVRSVPQLTARLLTPSGKERGIVLKCGTGVTFSPDGLYLAVTGSSTGWQPTRNLSTADQTRPVVIVDTVDGSEILVVHGDISSVAFSPDGKGFAFWRPRGQPPGFMPMRPVIRKEFATDAEAAWQALTGSAKEAHEAMWALVNLGPKTVTMLGERLKPTIALDASAIKQAITDLDDTKFAKREAASKRLVEAGSLVAPALKLALADRPSAEVRQRLEGILNTIEAEALTPSAESRRQSRAVGALERMGSPEALSLLEKLAAGGRETPLTEDALSAAMRLKRRTEK